jgi:hypothetical protein
VLLSNQNKAEGGDLLIPIVMLIFFWSITLFLHMPTTIESRAHDPTCFFM